MCYLCAQRSRGQQVWVHFRPIWQGPQGSEIYFISTSLGHCSYWSRVRMSIRNVALRERTPVPNPTVLSPPPPASAPSSPLATAPGCVVPVNTAVEQSTLGSPSCKVSLSSCSQKYWCFGARPSAANLMPSSGWDGCRDLCVLPEALKKERWHIKMQEGWAPPAEGWNFKLGEVA